MANKKFTQLPTVTNALSTDIIAAVQGGVSVEETLQQVHELFLDNTVLNYPGDPNGNVAGVTYQLLWDTVGLVLYVCTTSGNAATAVWTLASSGFISIPVPLTQGGTNKSLIANNGGIVWSDADSFEILPGVAQANRILLSGNTATPSWSTATFDSAYAASALLYSNGANTVTGLSTAPSAVLRTDVGGVLGWSPALTNGQVMIGSTGATPTPGTIAAGPGISIANGAGTITISGTGSGIGWTEVIGVTQAMAADNGYVANNAGLVTLTLPVLAAFGTAVNVVGKGAGGWAIAQNVGQSIRLGSSTTTPGVGGSLASTNAADSILLICTTANTVWTANGAPQGIITVV